MLSTWLMGNNHQRQRELEVRINRLEQRVAVLMELLGAELPELEADPQQVAMIRQALEQGRTIEAIKLLREATGCGLSEAKQAIDRDEWEQLLAGR
jgi:ribosomal protein L7/L12